MQKVIVDFGLVSVLGASIPLRIYGYGLMLVVGFLTAIGLAQWRARRAGEDSDHMVHCGILSLIGGIVGARAAYVIENWHEFARPGVSSASVFNISSGGLIYYGGVLLATALVVIYLRARGLSVRRYLDMIAVSLMVGLAFGRAGCTLNGCCYGARCRHDWPLGMRFPMYSKPLLRLGGGPGGFSEATDAPSPPYAHQLAVGEVHPDQRLINQAALAGRLAHPPRDLHGPLHRDQLTVMLGQAEAARSKFNALAGLDRRLSEAEWRLGLHQADGFLRGSEPWDEARLYDADGDGQLSFGDAWTYLQQRRARLVAAFDADGDGKLGGAERAAADAHLRADLWALAERERSQPVKPAQLLGLANALVLAGLLAAFYRMRTREGQVFALMLVLYPVTRFVLEGIRGDDRASLITTLLTHNQVSSLAILATGVIMWAVLRRMPASAGRAWAERASARRPARRGRR